MMKLYAVALVCCMSMSDAWKWAIAFSLGMALLVGVGQPYMRPQARAEGCHTFCSTQVQNSTGQLGNSIRFSSGLRKFKDFSPQRLSCMIPENIHSFSGKPTTEPKLRLLGRGISGFCLRLCFVGTRGVVGTTAASALAGATAGALLSIHCGGSQRMGG